MKPVKEAERKQKKWKVDRCERLSISKIPGKVRIVSTLLDVTEVEASGGSAVNDLKVENNGGVTMIRGDLTKSGGRIIGGKNVQIISGCGRGVMMTSGDMTVIMSGDNMTVTTVNGQITMMGGQALDADDVVVEPELEITIKARNGTKIALDDVIGGAKIEIGCGLTVLGDCGPVEAPVVDDLVVDTCGIGDIVVQWLTGEVDYRSSGTGSLTAQSANILTLKAKTTGTGGVNVNGSVRDAVLTTTGTGSIMVERVVGKLTQRATGTGRILVGR